MYWTMSRVSVRGCIGTVKGELEIAATVWVQQCAWMWVYGWMCVCFCAWVCMCIFHSFIDGGDRCLLSHHLWCSIPCNSPTLHMHSVTDFLSRSFLLPSLIPLPPPPPSPCSKARRGSFSTWPVCTGVLWAILDRPLSVTAVPSACVRISTMMMSGLWGSPTH